MLKNVAGVAAVVWLFTLVFIYLQLFTSPTPAISDEMMRSWQDAVDSLKTLRRQNDDLRQLLEDGRTENQQQHKAILNRAKFEREEAKVAHVNQVHEEKTVLTKEKAVQTEEHGIEKHNTVIGSRDFQMARRQLDDRIKEMFYYLNANVAATDAIRARTMDEMLSLLGASERLDDVVAADKVVGDRRQELAAIAAHIQRAIIRLQNPPVCDKARVLLCNLDKECGFGCQLHHVSYCFLTAFAGQRTLILKKDGQTWRYSTNGWKAAFLPISNCTHEEAVGKETPAQYSENSVSRVVTIGIIDGLTHKPDFLPLAFPKSLFDSLTALHSNPPVFFIGQFLSYLMRLNGETEKRLQDFYKSVPFGKGPIVGLQVRRTDKIGTEAAFHSVDEYMKWTEFWFQVQERRTGKNITRRVFVATDDPTVVPEAQKKYPQYEVLGSTEIAKTAQLSRRYSDASLLGVVTDIFVLSKMDYLVCTFSSQVCRMGYELRQATGVDDGTKFHSLDDIYYFGGQHAHEQVAIEAHEPQGKDEIPLRVGDRVGVAGNHWDGFSKGTNRRTGANGLYPSYKVVESWRTYDYKALLSAA